MPFEVEIKFRAGDHDDLARRLDSLGGRPGPAIAQEDSYFAHPARDFARTDEALRLRRDGPRTQITYKGPKLGGPTKTREEIEVALEDGPEGLGRLASLLERLGFRTVAVIRKARTPYDLEFAGRPLVVALDRAEGLGDFAEVETIADGPEDLPAAQAAVKALAEALGLAEVETRSYLRMTLERNSAGRD